MLIDIVTIFPGLFDAWLHTGLLGRAVASGVVRARVHDLRAHGVGPHRSVDDEPYGGGAGMVLRPEPIFAAVESIREPGRVVLLSARGRRFDHAVAAELAALDHIVLVCGRYEGVDERVAVHLADDEVSIGDYVLAGGEAAAVVVVEATTRLLPGVVGNAASLEWESHSSGMLEYPQYTRPARFRDWDVPAVLLSGNHAAIRHWRAAAATEATRERRPDFEG